MAYKRQKLISHSSGGQKSKIRVPAWLSVGENPLLGWRLPTSHCVLIWQKGEGALWGLFFIFLAFFFFFFFYFFVCVLPSMWVSLLGFKSELQLPAYTTAVSATYSSAHTNSGSSTHWVRGQGSNLRPHWYWSDRFITTAPAMTGTPGASFTKALIPFVTWVSLLEPNHLPKTLQLLSHN